MPYEKSTEKLQAFVQQVLADPTKSEIDESALYRAITKDSKEIWAVVSSETSEYDASEARLLAEEAKLSASLGLEPDPENARAGYFAGEWWPGMLFGIGIFLTIGTLRLGGGARVSFQPLSGCGAQVLDAYFWLSWSS